MTQAPPVTVDRKASLTWYMASCLPRLRRIDKFELDAIFRESEDALACDTPLHMSDIRVTLPTYLNEPITGTHATAVAVCALWIKLQEDEALAFALIETFPMLRDALSLVGRVTQ